MKKKIIGGLGILVFLLFGGMTALLSSMSNQELVLACTTDLIQLPKGMSCSYLTMIRNPDPNQVDTSYTDMTLFGFVVNGLDEPDSQVERADALMVHMMENGADLNASHDRGLTALHMAVLAGSESLVKRFIEAGADPSVKAKAAPLPDGTKRSYDGLNAYDFSARLLSNAQRRKASADIEIQTKIGALFKEAGATLTAVPKPPTPPPPAVPPAPADAAPAPAAGDAPPAAPAPKAAAPADPSGTP